MRPVYLGLGRWNLPVEPHIRVPLVNLLWPRPAINPVPAWWFEFWARMGFRSPYQHGKTVDEVVKSNVDYCAGSLNYLPHHRHVVMSEEVFGNCEYPMHFFLQHTYGGAAGIYRKAIGKAFLAWLFKHTRIALMVQRKSPVLLGPAVTHDA